MDQDSATDFDRDVLPSEHKSINERRGEKKRMGVSGTPSRDAPPIYDTVGLALSGGGIRSAAVSLGVLQALHTNGVLDKIDYLSTVSGGGYIGGSLAATMTVTGGKFVFVDEAESLHTPAVAHLRNFSNYLLAGGKHSVGSAVAIIVRGLVVNLAIVLPFILLLAAITSDSRFIYIPRPLVLGGVSLSPQHFRLTFALIYLGFELFLFWGLWVSFLSERRLSDESSRLPLLAARYIAAVALVFVIETQLFLLDGMLSPSLQLAAVIVYLMYFFALVGLPVTLAALLFQRNLANIFARAKSTTRLAILLSAGLGRLIIWVVAAELPLILWLTFLNLAYWDRRIKEEPSTSLGGVSDHPWFAGVPDWLVAIISGIGLSGLYSIVALLLAVVGVFLKPNAVSLHGLYRDRLRRAFFFDPDGPSDRGYEPLTDFPVSRLSAAFAPYQLINAALNIRGTSYANQRGRDADFFLFSPNFVGSAVTGYVPAQEFEAAQQGFDLATAIAISGAAVSSSMGAHSIRPLAPTLALLNIRLGYWLRNPKRLNTRLGWFSRLDNSLYRATTSLWLEMTGQLYTDESDEVYVTDGGHIENLGLYELLHRRCKFIICIDSEADPEMRFGSFMALQRYVGIDLGIQITLPWEAIQKETVKWMGYDPLAITNSAGPLPNRGPHAAIGVIRYRGGQEGFLLYIKASLTGDESDYVRDYARRYGEFPHETTGKQFFNEEQFEIYRALGFHMAEGVFSGRDQVKVLEGVERPQIFGRQGS